MAILIEDYAKFSVGMLKLFYYGTFKIAEIFLVMNVIYLATGLLT